jgi:hypothetical protein
MMLAAVSLIIGGLVGLAAVAGAIGFVATVYGLFGMRNARVSYRPIRWSATDWIILGAATLTGGCFAFAVVFSPPSIEWSPFPRLGAPPFAAWLGLACLLLVTPALVGGTTE